MGQARRAERVVGAEHRVRRPSHRRAGGRSRRWALPLLVVGLIVALWSPVASATGSLARVGWATSSTVPGATGTDYFFYFTIATGNNLTGFDMTLPAGTLGTPTVGYVTGESATGSGAYAINPTTSSPTLASSTLSVPFGSTFYPSGATVEVEVTGLTNTSSAGSYASTISTIDSGTTIDQATSETIAYTASTLTSVYTSPSDTLQAASDSLTFGLETATSSNLSSVTFTIPPGTTGTPSLISVSPAAVAGGTLSVSGRLVTYSFAATPVSPGTFISIDIGGLTNTPVTWSFMGDVATYNGSSPVDSAPLSPINITAATLGWPTWSATPTTAGSTGAAYTYGFTITTALALTAVTMSLPPGTSGTPVLGTASAQSAASGGYSLNPTWGTPTMSGSTLTVPMAAYFPSGGVVSIQVTGLTNTAQPGSYSSAITTFDSNAVVDSGVAAAVAFTSISLTSLSWTPSSTATGATNVSYTYDFTISATSTLTAVTMTLPAGTGSAAAGVGTVTPSAVSGGTVSEASNVLTYTLPGSNGVSLAGGAAVSIEITGMTNTSTPGSYVSTITAMDNGNAVASGATPGVNITSTVLTALSWQTTSTATGQASTAYKFGFTTASAATLTQFTMSVPPGTSVTGGGSALGIGTVSAQSSSASGAYNIPLGSPAATLSTANNLITFTYSPAESFPSGAVVSIQVTGLTNTSTAGSYASTITTYDGSTTIDSGTTPSVSFTTTTLTGLSWSASPTSEGATGASYTYSFGLSQAATLGSIQMGVPPGTKGTPTITSVSPPSVASGGTIALDTTNDVLKYDFSPAAGLTSSQTITLTFGGLQNTATAGSYSSDVTVYDGSGSVVASGVTPSVTITATALSSISWLTTSTAAGATGVGYTYDFTTASGSNLSQFTMSVPAGTTATGGGSTLGIGTVTAQSSSAPGSYAIAIGSPAATLSTTNNLITFTFTSVYFPSGAVVSVQVTGITNTSTPGTYSSAITTYNSTQAIDSGTSPTNSFSSAVLGSPTWSVSQSGVGQTNSSYTYSFGFPDQANVSTITMTVPAGTAGTATVSSATPASVTGGTVSLAGQTLTYTVPAADPAVSPGSTITLVIGGITNTSTAGTYSSTITTAYQGTALASGTTPSVSITQSVLSALSWTTSSSVAAATAVSYTFGFTTGAPGNTLTAITMTVPPGTGGTPSLGTVSPTETGASVAFVSGQSELEFSFASGTYINANTAFSIQVTGLTNTATTGSYTSSITCLDGAATIYAGSTGSVSFFASGVTLTAPSSLTWAVSLTGVTETVVDTTTGDQQYSVTDNTGQNAGWNVTISATTFTNGSEGLPNAGTLSTNGSTASSASSLGPTVTCVSSCTAPTNGAVYPIAITTAPSAPTAYVIFSAATGTGSGSFLIGGSGNSDPVGWWASVPPTAYAGTYTSTVTFSIGSGP
ncbi:MAG: beta strand repeat-containing protein [Acidimicrobiales bacterium]